MPHAPMLPQDLPLFVGGVSSGGSFALKLNKEMAGEIKGAFSEVLSMDPDNDDGTDVSRLLPCTVLWPLRCSSALVWGLA